MKRVPNVTITDPDGRELKLQGDTGLEPATTASMIRVVCIGLRDQTRMTMLDSQQGLRVMRKVAEADGFIELDPGDHKWLLQKVDEVAPVIFGVSAALLREQIDAAVDTDADMEVGS